MSGMDDGRGEEGYYLKYEALNGESESIRK
jgi:hypothetical protein